MAAAPVKLFYFTGMAFFNEVLLRSNARSKSGRAKHTLIIRSVQRQDFANYSCYATNSLGRARAYITLRGETEKG